MKKIIVFLCLLASFQSLFAQLFNNGDTIFVSENASLYIKGNYQSTTSAALFNNATIELTGNWQNLGTAMQLGLPPVVVFSGDSSATLLAGQGIFNNIHLKKNNANLSLLGNLTLNRELKFFNDNNFVLLGANTMVINTVGTIIDASQTRFVVTNGTGQLRKNNCSTFTFPVGFSPATFSPMTITETNIIDNKGVRCREHVLANGGGGAALTQGVADVSWTVTESGSGGSNLNVTCQWKGSEELPLFDRNNCVLHRHFSSAWNVLGSSSAAAGADPYTQSASGVLGVSHFMVGTPGAFLFQANTRASTNEIFDKIEIYPNPAFDLVNIRSENGKKWVSLQLLDMNGRVLQTKNLNGEVEVLLETLNFDGFISGTYLLRLLSETDVIVRRVEVIK